MTRKVSSPVCTRSLINARIRAAFINVGSTALISEPRTTDTGYVVNSIHTGSSIATRPLRVTIVYVGLTVGAGESSETYTGK